MLGTQVFLVDLAFKTECSHAAPLTNFSMVNVFSKFLTIVSNIYYHNTCTHACTHAHTNTHTHTHTHTHTEENNKTENNMAKSVEEQP